MGPPVNLKAAGPPGQCPFWQLNLCPDQLTLLWVRLFFPASSEPLDCPSPHASWALVTSCVSQAASPRPPPFSVLHLPHPWQHPKKFSLLHLLSETGKIFPPEFLMLSSLPKPKSPDLPCANKHRERLFGWIQKWPWTFAQHSDDRFSPFPPHPNTHASCWIRKCFIAFFPFHFLYHPSSWILPTYPFPITSLLEN